MLTQWLISLAGQVSIAVPSWLWVMPKLVGPEIFSRWLICSLCWVRARLECGVLVGIFIISHRDCQSTLVFLPPLPDQRLFMVFVSKDNLGGDFRIIPGLLNLRFLLFCSSVPQLQNIKLSFKCCPYIRSSYSLSKNLKCVVSTHLFQQSSCCWWTSLSI